MNQETEVMFGTIDKDAVRAKLREVGATLKRVEHDQKRMVFDLPTPDTNKWLRVRDEGDRVTLSYKEAGTTLEAQQEIEVVVSDFARTCEIVSMLGCTPRSKQETKREEWFLDGATVTIDTWPHLEPLIEIEGDTEEVIKAATAKLGFDYSRGIFGTVNLLYKAKYGKFIEDLPGKTLAFEGGNPFE
jgi:adenylate cyclase class 2